jgi:hypothetical protein
MALGPKYKIGDVVYSVESASLGELDAYRIGSIHQKSPGVWVYQFYIEKRPPDQQTVEDRIDLRSTWDLFYEETDLTDLCTAVHLAVLNVQARINRVTLLLQNCGTDVPAIIPNNARFSLTETVWIKASADIGFLETHKVIEIHRAPDAAEYIYRLDTDGSAKIPTNPLRSVSAPSWDWPVLYFRERELVSQCEALNMVMVALERKISRLLAIKLTLCTVTPPPGP